MMNHTTYKLQHLLVGQLQIKRIREGELQFV